MRVLVTGHAGYVGSVLAPFVRESGHEVVGLDTYLYEGCTLGPEPPAIPALALDIRDVEVGHLRGFDAIVHLAALSNDPVGHLDPARTYEINHRAAANLGRLAKEAGVRRFVFASSCSLYGAASPSDLLGEDAPLRAITPYGESKVLAERDLSETANGHFSPIYLRNATVYGHSPRLRLDLVVNDFVASAFTDGKIRIESDGTPWRPLVHVEDVAQATVAALEAPTEAIHDQAFNIGQTTENYQVSQIAEIVARAVPGSSVVFAEGGRPDARCYRVDFSKAERNLPGFRPRWTLLDGIRQLVAAYRRFGLTQNDLARFIRLRRIQALREAGRLGADIRWVPALQGSTTPG